MYQDAKCGGVFFSDILLFRIWFLSVGVDLGFLTLHGVVSI
jgi:hypothetical protein